jgi:hypothetical protein
MSDAADPSSGGASGGASGPPPERDPRTGLFKPVKSYGGAVDENHWSKGRDARNAEALDYYRDRSHAPGVAEGGGPRNCYCMECDGVVPLDGDPERCPHCGASLAGGARRYFNWVEIDRPVESDARALLPFAAAGLGLLVVVAVLVAWFLS